MKKCKVYLKDVECPHCGFLNDELRSDGLEANCDWDIGISEPTLSCLCKECRFYIFLEEEDIDFGE